MLLVVWLLVEGMDAELVFEYIPGFNGALVDHMICSPSNVVLIVCAYKVEVILCCPRDKLCL